MSSEETENTSDTSESKRTSQETKRLQEKRVSEPKSASFADDLPDKGLDTVLELNENVVSELLDRPVEVGEYVEITPRIFSKKDILSPNLTIDALNTAIYELGVINLCWPKFLEPPEPELETRTCFPWTYYTNTSKERMLLSYAENFRRQMHFYFKHMRKPLLLQAPNDCGLQVAFFSIFLVPLSVSR